MNNRTLMPAILAVALLAAARPAGAAEIDPGLLEQIQTSDDGRAFAVVMLDAPPLSGLGAPARRRAVRGVQDGVLNDLPPGAFTVVYRYATFPALAGRITAAGLAALAADPAVRAIGPDASGTAQLASSGPFIGATAVHALGFDGAGITVAVLDTGADNNHPDLASSMAPGQYKFLFQGAVQSPGAQDQHGHGTRVTGIITSDGTVAPPGIAPAADVLAIQVLDAGGNGWASDWAAGMDYVVANRHLYDDLRAINCSFGTFDRYDCGCDFTTSFNQLLAAAAQAAVDAGIAVFAASGNNGSCTDLSSPGCVSAATAIGAVHHEAVGRAEAYFGCADAETAPDLVTCFTSRSSECALIAAPGYEIVTTALGGGQSIFTGTSAATPHCTATAALMWQKAAALGADVAPAQIIEVMTTTAAPAIDDRCPEAAPTVRVDALAAVDAVTACLGPFSSGNPNCPADIDCNGSVNVDDLVAIILAWGTSDPAADIDDSGGVDVDDLVAVIVAWGDC